ncbi:hypothetical protein DPV78_006314 [Talaromyces pinophilus]|nr:hypothetical protein DPV78_006314 [Talaromyces pinophilus]
MALEQTAGQNVYKIKELGFPGCHRMFLPANRLVSFTKSLDADIEPSSPILLATHAAIAQIMAAAGVVRAFDNLIEDFAKLLGVEHLFYDGRTDLAKYFSLLMISKHHWQRKF